MANNNFKNHIGKFIAENENNRFTELKTDGDYSLWKDSVTDKYYCCKPSDEEDCPHWFEAEYVASISKDAWDAWDFKSEADEDEFTDIIAFLEISGEIEYEDGVWIEWFELKHIEYVYAYVSNEENDPVDKIVQDAMTEDFMCEHFPNAKVLDTYVETDIVKHEGLNDREFYQMLCEELKLHRNSTLVLASVYHLVCLCNGNDIMLSEELDRLKEMGVRVVTTDGYFDSISPSSFDVLAREHNNLLPPHAVMLHRITMAEYKCLGKPQGFVLEDIE